MTSIIETKLKTTKIVFLFGVINNLTEFNFYYLYNALEKMKNFHYKVVLENLNYLIY